MKFFTYRDDYLKMIAKQGKSASTQKGQRLDLDCFAGHLLKSFGEPDLERFMESNVQLYGDYLATQYPSPNSRRRRLQTVRQFFDYLMSKGVVTKNPIREIPTSPKRVDRPSPTSYLDIMKLIGILKRESDTAHSSLERLMAIRNRLIIALIAGAGVRVRDLEILQEDHLRITRRHPPSLRILIEHPKRDPYTVPLSNSLIPLFQDYQELVAKEKRRARLRFDDLLFNANPHHILSGGLSARGIEVIFEEFRRKARIDITAKNLRQSAIFAWLHQGVSETTIKEWLGVIPSYSLAPYIDQMKNHPFAEFDF